ncbi:hypothetical protein JL100_016225 [Skermanella mucosa]|uniref:hypothetical protein n=1 Tax=Skermanella mucosa TaxID=1789672 RepID=UPI001E3C3781|nr:hypothetical protein [Skermanella mucosa]UEM18664.1 hypothetical protein JL100_016225 [Skermanella mucosa]
MIKREAVHGMPESWLNYPDLSLIPIKAAVASCDVTEGIVERILASSEIPVFTFKEERLIPCTSLAIISDFYGKQVTSVRNVLESAARRRDIVTYRNLAEAAGLDYHVTRDKRILSKIIETVCQITYSEYSLLLPAIARRTYSMTSMPSENFYIVADRLGCKVDDDRTFLEDQTKKIWYLYSLCPRCYLKYVNGSRHCREQMLSATVAS